MYNETREVSIRQLFLALLIKWRILLFFAICGILAGIVVFYVGGMRALLNQEVAEEKNKNSQDEYEEYMKAKERYEYIDQLLEQTIDEQNIKEIPSDQEELQELNYLASYMQYLYLFKDRLSVLEDKTYNYRVIQDSNTNDRADPRSIKILVKKVFLGFLTGCLCGIFCIIVWYIVSGTVMSSYEMSNRYDIETLTVLNKTHNKSALIKGEDSLYLSLDVDGQCKVCSDNIDAFAPLEKDILLVSSLAESEMDGIKALLQEKLPKLNFSFVTRINKSISIHEALRKAENIILVEKVLTSKYIDIDDEVRLIRKMGKRIIGTVIVY